MEKDISKYILDGISIDGNPTDGYSVFTIKTQRFKVASLDELTVERFEKTISDLKERSELENEMFMQLEHSQYFDWQGYIDGKYDSTIH